MPPWKGTASYYDVVVDGEVNDGAAWYYPTPKDAAANMANYVAFWRGVSVEAHVVVSRSAAALPRVGSRGAWLRPAVCWRSARPRG